MTELELKKKLRALPAARIAVQNLDNALSMLTPEELLVANYLLLYPKMQNIALVCQKLNLEEAAVYRRRKKVLKKLLAAINQSVVSNCDW